MVGTVIPQDVPLEEIRQASGNFYYRLVTILDLNRVYRSWWFMLLLLFLSLNLLGCLIRRLRVIRQEWTGSQERKSFNLTFSVSGSFEKVRETILPVVTQIVGTRPRSSMLDGRMVFAWSKHKVYLLGFPLIHSAILIILVGAVVGILFGFKGNLHVKEGATGNKFSLTPSGRMQSLPFDIEVLRFHLVRYPTGEPKEFRSDVRLLRSGTELTAGSIRVNHPLTFEGISLFQSDYRVAGVREIRLTVQGPDSQPKDFVLHPNVTERLPGTDVQVRLLSLDPGTTKRGVGVDIGWQEPEGQMQRVKIFRNDSAPVMVKDTRIRFVDYQPLYSTGLQIGYDPGSRVVWAGCILLMVGFLFSLFTNLRRVSIVLATENGRTVINVSGRSRKMRREFREQLETSIRRSLENF